MRTLGDEIKDAFFDAMRAGYAQSVPKMKVEEVPGLKVIPFVSGNIKVMDSYIVTPQSDRSDGATIIWSENEPVWIMHYGGWYEKGAIPFLKSCLHQAYAGRDFYGGRGPRVVRGELFTYFNWVEQDDFEKFKGAEAVFDIDGDQVGYHWYRGGSLLKK